MAANDGNVRKMTFLVSEDAWEGDAQFVVVVDGRQVGDVQTVTADHRAGEWQEIAITAAIPAGPADIALRFMNDAWGGTDAADRNLYVGGMNLDGQAWDVQEAGTPPVAALFTEATAIFAPQAPSGLADTSGVLTLMVAEDGWEGDARFVVLADGKQVGGVQTATASHAAGRWQMLTLSGGLPPQTGNVTLQFLNDAWGGTAATDRNLYVGSLHIGGATYAGSTAQGAVAGPGSEACLFTGGAITFDLRGSPAAALPVAAVPANLQVLPLAFGPNDWLSAGPVLQYDSTQAWSVSATVRIDAAPPALAPNLPEGGANLIFGNTNGAPYRGYEMWVDHDSHMRIRIMSSFADGKYIDVAGSTDVVSGHWLSVGATYDGSGHADGVRMFIDGAAEPVSVIRDTLSGSSVSDGPMIVGNQLNGWENQFQLRGEMASFAISDEVRPQSYFDPSAPDFDRIDAHSQLAYAFHEGSGLITTDLSGHGHDGSLSSALMRVIAGA